ncbi:MAG TPA: hypothetical protein DE042_10205 [Colwellia sp.]|nr:hypothetical protein [Colwellia sp.]
MDKIDKGFGHLDTTVDILMVRKLNACLNLVKTEFWEGILNFSLNIKPQALKHLRIYILTSLICFLKNTNQPPIYKCHLL